MPAYAFLFSIAQLEIAADDLRRASYADPAKRPFFLALLDVDTDPRAICQVRHGDVLLHNLAYKVSEVRYSGKKTKYGREGIAHTSAGDPTLYQTLIWDFCDSVHSAWTSLDTTSLADRFAKWDVYGIAVSALEEDVACGVDDRMAEYPAYLGGLQVDLGNPVHRRVLAGGLIHDFDYVQRSLVFDPWESEDPIDPPPLERHGDEWWIGLPLTAVRYWEDGETLRDELPDWPVEESSERGAITALIVEHRLAPNHLERLARELGRMRVGADTPPFEVATNAMPDASEAVIEKEKLVGYVLNVAHETGRLKARLFERLLGISAADWEFLSDQFKEGIARADTLLKVRSSDHGVHYHAVVPITGRNGVTKPVVSAWEVSPGGSPRLTTAYVADRGLDLSELSPAPEPKVLPTSLVGQDRWSELWDLAHRTATQAASDIVPTPMRVEGTWVPEGPFGKTEISVRDARRGFARWLVKQGYAHTERRKGAVFFAPGIAVERGEAYGRAFQAVLKANGVAANIVVRLD